ncbi:RICIN domain-containing protein, partial [Streptomyces mexicanus]|uniref:RICIN domain-containing protein n=1 Tax=Streptomyces mexicanus TaxID=178566 RepID=UPI00365BA544
PRAARPGGRRGAAGLGPLSRIPFSRVPLSRTPLPGRPEQAARTAAGLVLAGLLATLLGVALWPSGGGDTAPAASSGASGTPATVPGAGRPSTPAPARSGPPGPPPGPGEARLRNVATGLCLDIRGTPGPGADARLAACSAAPTQQWTLEADGLLRSSADPGLCLDSHADAGVVVLGTCAGADTRRGPDVRYDLTVRGELLPRWDERLALAFTTAAPDAAVVTKVRDRSAAQQWATDAASPAPLPIAGAGARPGRPSGPPETHRPSGPSETRRPSGPPETVT